MRPHRVLLLLVAALLAAVATSGLQFSSATFTSTSGRPVVVTAANDWTPPTVTLTDPGSPLTGTVTVAATAADARSAIASVVIQRSTAGSSTWTTICTDTVAPYACSWATTAVADGDHRLRAVATDTAGYAATSAPVTSTVLNNVGVDLATVSSPVRGTVPLTITVTGAGSATVTTRVEYAVAGTGTWATVPGCGNASGATRTCSADTTAVGTGTYDVRAVAVVGTGTYLDTQAGVLVDNVAPTVALTVPAGPLSGTVNLTATAGDADSGVASVAFQYRPSASSTWSTCGTDTTAPYSCVLDSNGLAAGSHDFRAVATDRAGNATTTATVTRAVDATLRAQDVQAVDNGTLGRVEAGDQLVLTYSRVVDLTTVRAGWTGAATPVAVTLKDAGVAGAGTGTDRIETDANLGYVTLAQDYVKNGLTVALTGSTMTAATATVNGVQVTVVTITLGTVPSPNDLRNTSNAGELVWFPSTLVRTPGGAACLATSVTESGTSDRDF